MKHVLHNHPRSEWKLSIPSHEVIVDEEFADLFSVHWILEKKPGHIVVNIDEFIKNGGSFNNKTEVYSYWKRPKDELPKDEEKVIFRDSRGFDRMGIYDAFELSFYEYMGSEYEANEVVAWFPIPEYDLEDE